MNTEDPAQRTKLMAAEALCIYRLTDGFCHPALEPNCKCWSRAKDALMAMGLSDQALAWVMKNRAKVEEMARS